MDMKCKIVAHLITAVVVSALVSTAAYGAGLGYLAKEADVIVIGSITNRTEGLRGVSFELSISRVLKGVVSGNSVRVAHEWIGLLRGPDRVLRQSLTGLWFLRQQSGDAWDVLTSRPAWHRTIHGLFLPASATPPGGVFAYSPEAPLIDVLVYEVAATSSSVDPFMQDPSILLGAFESLNTQPVLAVLKQCSRSGSPSLLAVGVTGMIEREVPEAIPELVRLWSVISVTSHREYVLDALRNMWRDARPRAVQELAALAKSVPPEDDLRSAAAVAFSAMHTKETLPYLAYLLSSSKRDEQLQGIYGLGAFANGCPMKTRANLISMGYLVCTQPSEYRTSDTEKQFAFLPGDPAQEAALARFWQDWWRSRPELH